MSALHKCAETENTGARLEEEKKNLGHNPYYIPAQYGPLYLDHC